MSEKQTDGGYRGVFDTMTSGGELVIILILIGVMLFLFVSPVKILRGEANGTAQYIAGTVALAVWALAIGTAMQVY